jgi:hypothetical protein
MVEWIVEKRDCQFMINQTILRISIASKTAILLMLRYQYSPVVEVIFT